MGNLYNWKFDFKIVLFELIPDRNRIVNFSQNEGMSAVYRLSNGNLLSLDEIDK
ncbi:hypothetical protein ISU82_14560 [Leptospira borgpetersenii serovar Balcanica]|uniref:hypothetical protein n=1 Tax=Leptospira borgpetersenii TaxID=174 RepID=UPI000B0C9D67|nr:hypothetical protein [Leptospira borgpetersenii]MBE8424189.1 hypothetical protein [Leptospira borgpetersenii serovar Balcanica]MBF3351288.1 hypothetical protein [Leptospira borgpetersenii serovar Balcanica]